MNPLVSIIIPIYNVEAYIKECLDSVVAQTYKNIEVICVDDCGKDNSIQIVKNYVKRYKHIKIIHHETNRGLGISRNTGTDAANGKYIFYLDSDDYITPDIIEVLISTMQRNPADVIISKTNTFVEDKEDKWQIDRKKAVDNYLFAPAFSQYICDDISTGIEKVSAVAWGKLYNRDFLNKNNIRFANKNIIHEDDGFNVKILANKPIISWIDNVGVMYRLRKNSITSDIEQQNQQKKKIIHMQETLSDAFGYIVSHIQNNSDQIINNVKQSENYERYFVKRKNILGVIKIYWSPKTKWVKLFGVKVFKKNILPKISIIVPFYNTVKNSGTEKYLRQNIQSLISQTYKNYEIIYVDNNSTDNSKEIILEYNSDKIRIISEISPGVANARNAGVEIAVGDYITFVDSDDFVSKNYLKKTIKKLSKKPDILVGQFTMCRGSSKSIKTLRYAMLKKYGNKIKNIYASIECPHNIFFNLKFIKKHKIRQNPQISIGEDNLFNVTAILNTNNVKFFNSFDYFYQVLEGSSSNVKSDKYFTFIEAYDKIFHMAIQKYGTINVCSIEYFNIKCNTFKELSENRNLFIDKVNETKAKYNIS